MLTLHPATLLADKIYLDQLHFDHIHFKRIKSNTVSFNNGVINFSVNSTASFLLHAFDDIKPVKQVSFQWRANGNLNKKDAQHETTRKGDDAWVRVGLILKGEPKLQDPLVPPWVKQVRKTLKYPSDKMVYLIPDAQQTPGTTWSSPYNKNVEMRSVASDELKDGWQAVHYRFERPQQVIGIWLMADGDNTHSKFNTQLKELVIE